MENFAILLDAAPQFTLVGDLVHVESVSGEHHFQKVLTINQCMVASAGMQRVIAEWVENQRRDNVLDLRAAETD